MVFKTAALNHSATLPFLKVSILYLISLKRTLRHSAPGLPPGKAEAPRIASYHHRPSVRNQQVQLLAPSRSANAARGKPRSQ